MKSTKLRNYKPLLLLLISSLMFYSCATDKKSVINRTYHNTTAHYNGYFNGKMRVKDGVLTLANSTKDNYDRILPIFQLGEEESAKAVFPDMDAAIKKTSVVISRHSMQIDGKEYCNWIDDNFFLMGQALFYKREYWDAIEKFQYISAEYKDQPIRYDALVWLTRCYLELGKFTDAEYLLDYLKNEDIPKKLKSLHAAVNAQYYVLKKDYEPAAKQLGIAAEHARKRQTKIRYTFIQAQLYNELDDNVNAFEKYNQVLKLNPSYEMAFNAKISRARAFDVTSENSGKVKEELLKMLKDSKNDEYKDQIYYALAGISQKENNEPEAIERYNLSIRNSVKNDNQKAQSYLELAKIYYDRPDYKYAKAYYDSCVTFLDQGFPDYDGIFNMQQSLAKLVAYLTIIEQEDSLQAMANLSPAEQKKQVEDRIKAEQEAERLKKEAEAQKELAAKQENEQSNQIFNPNKDPNQKAPVTGGGWALYNTSALSFGYTEFVQKWGKRELSDDWRRSKKTPTTITTNELSGGVDGIDPKSGLQDSLSKLDVSARQEAYLSAIPNTPEMLEASNANIIESYYNVGIIYREQLNDLPESAKNFTTLLKRYPENKYILPSYYNLYLIYKALGVKDKEEYYKNILLNNYPDSDYSRIIENPNFYAENRKKTAVLDVFYENTYISYKNEKYNTVIERKAMADTLFPPNNRLASRFSFLKALAVGKTQNKDNFVASLKDVVLQYPDDSVALKAQQILDIIEGGKIPVDQNNISIFNFDEKAEHYYMIVFENRTLDLNNLKVRISNFNNEFYSTQNLIINSSFLDQDKQFLLVKMFDDSKKALAFLNSVNSDTKTWEGMSHPSLKRFVISADNFVLLFKNKKIDHYISFHAANYLK